MFLYHVVPTIPRENENFSKEKKMPKNYLALQPYILYSYFFSYIKRTTGPTVLLDRCLSNTGNLPKIQ